MRRCATLAGTVVIMTGLAACGASSAGAPTTGPSSAGATSPPNSTSSAGNSSSSTAFRTAVCLAVNDGKAGKWSEAQQEWLAAQNAVPASAQLDLGIKLLNLNIATASLAIDTLGGGPAKASDLATYQSDLNALPSGTTTGC